MVSLSLLSLLLAPAALAAPWRRNGFDGPCPVPPSAFNFPPNFDQLSGSPNLVLMGIGNQNYSCDSTSTYISTGAVGQMFDVSCLYPSSEFYSIQNDAFNIWNACPETDPLGEGIALAIQDAYGIYVDGQHYFVMQNGGLEAVWDMRSSGEFEGNPDAIVFAHKIQSSPSPSGPENIDWVELTKDEGSLANTVYRINTVQGQPPPTCNPGDTTTVKYATIYLLV